MFGRTQSSDKLSDNQHIYDVGICAKIWVEFLVEAYG